ncbi:MAG: ATP-dependent Clp protease ATP-binding subunit [Tepidisphaera sp.]
MANNAVFQIIMLCATGFSLLFLIANSLPGGWFLVLALLVFCVGGACTLYLLRYEPKTAASLHTTPGFRQFIDAVCAVTSQQAPSGGVAAAAGSGAPRPSDSPATQDRTAAADDGITPRSAEDFASIRTSMTRRVIGHDDAIAGLLSHLERSVLLRRRRGHVEDSPPLGVFLLVGPAGIGKRHLSIQLAAHLFTRPAVLTLRGGDYADPATAAQLLFGSVSQPGVLLAALRTNPQQVVFIESTELVAPKALQMLRDAIRAGCAVDESGRSVSFKDAVVIFSTAKGQSSMDAAIRRHGDVETRHSDIIDAMSRELGSDPEFFAVFSDYYLLRTPDPEQRALILLHIMSRICAEYGVELAYVEPRILLAEVVALPPTPMFESAPDRLRRRLIPELADLAKRSRHRLIWQLEEEPIRAGVREERTADRGLTP